MCCGGTHVHSLLPCGSTLALAAASPPAALPNTMKFEGAIKQPCVEYDMRLAGLRSQGQPFAVYSVEESRN